MSENSSLSFQIVAENITKTFGAEVILRNFSAQFNCSEKYAITGANGSGKSTLLKILAGLSFSNKGKLEYFDQGNRIPPENWHRHLSFCSPAQELLEEFTLGEMVNFHLKFRSFVNGFDKKMFLETCYLSEHQNKKIGLFSSGMRQRLKLSLALFTSSDALFLDEPTTNMDEKGVEWYRQQILKTSKNRLIIIASNQKEEYDFCERKVEMSEYK